MATAKSNQYNITATMKADKRPSGLAGVGWKLNLWDVTIKLTDRASKDIRKLVDVGGVHLHSDGMYWWSIGRFDGYWGHRNTLNQPIQIYSTREEALAGLMTYIVQQLNKE